MKEMNKLIKENIKKAKLKKIDEEIQKKKIEEEKTKK